MSGLISLGSELCGNEFLDVSVISAIGISDVAFVSIVRTVCLRWLREC